MRRLPLDHPGTADHRSAAYLLLWMVRGQWRTLLGGVLLGIVWMLCQAVMPAIIGQAIDQGITAKDMSALLGWVALMLGIGLVQAASGILRHRMAVTNWLTAAYRVVQLVTRQAVRLGATLPRRVATGEVVSIGTSDLSHIGNAMDVTARASGAVVSFGVVAALLLRTSTTLGLVVLIGVPVSLLTLGPLLKPLQRRNLHQRAMMGDLANLASDIVSGLRVLRGIGGEKVFHDRYVRESAKVRAAGVEVGRLQSVLDAAQVGLPGLFITVVVWLGARLAVQERITVGELVAFYGYAAFLMIPLRTATEAINKWIRAFVSAGRICAVLRVEPDVTEPADPLEAPSAPADLVDVSSGVRIEPRRWTALVCERPEDTAAILDRLGGYAAGDVRWGEVPLEQISPAVVRRRIVVGDTGAVLFSGTLAESLDVTGCATQDQLLAALQAAAAEDILDAVTDGLESEVTERGRSFSGGQRQRLVLARLLAVAPEVLLLAEPTSAVDAHTEARIGDRLREHRAGLTTVTATTSPLLLDRADVVLFVDEGRVVAAGTHRDLLRDVAGYRSVVVREEVAR